VRVAIITPFYLQSTRGNAVTVRRIERYLQKTGCVAKVFSLDTLAAAAVQEAVRSFSPDILHAFHAVHCGALTAQIAKELQLPYVITITGTELYRGGEQEFSVAEGLTLQNVAALVVFHDVIGKRVSDALPTLADRLKIIPQGVELPDNSSAETLPDSTFIFLLPAGIRQVKNLLFPFAPLAELNRRYPQVKLVIAGPAIDADYTRQLLAKVATNPFSSWVGEVAYADMPALYWSAQVVLNTSLSEGGMANSILEGMAYGRPVLVSDIEGNRSLVSDDVNGYLFSSAEEFLDKAERLLLDEALRKRLAAAGRSYVLENCVADKEAKSYLELYLKILAKGKGV
jgi:glycosyltransferase involved in cell wall biosynthesis